MNRAKMALAVKLLMLVLCGVFVQAGVYTERGSSTEALYNQRGDTVQIYPDVSGPIDVADYSYFNNRLDFTSFTDRILIGAADRLFLLDKNLRPVENGVLAWTSNGCNGNSINDPVICRNHIRVYETLPDDNNRLFVCGTFATSPLCTTIEIVNGGFTEVNSTSTAAQGIISPDPNLPGFGEFRRSSSNDTTYFGANFRTTQTNEFDVSYLEVTDDSDTSRLYGLQLNSDKWLKNPLFFVDYIRADYPPLNQPEDYQFYFVFLRESLNNAEREIIISRVVRICRNDASINGPGGQTIFNSYVKAQIFCEREIPPGNKFVGAQNFQYNEIWSVALNARDGGRFVDGGTYSHFMYGAFSGPLIGPPGTAICAYAADNTGFNRGLFDIFRENVINTDIEEPQTEPTLVECDPQGRTSERAQYVNVARNMEQIGENPLVIFDGFHVTQIAVDVVCVVSKTDRTRCSNQDILFLGTSTGKVMKLMFASSTANENSMTPILSEEIELDDSNPVNEMKIEMVDGVKQLFIATDSRLYRLPLESCDRYNLNNSSNETSSFNNCIGSRDPYCVWNNVDKTCEASQLSAVGDGSQSVPQHILQNVFGTIDLPFVEFQLGTYQVSESIGIMTLNVTSTQPVPDGIILVQAISQSAQYGVDFSLPSLLLPLTFNDMLQASIAINITNNNIYDPTRVRSFQLRLVPNITVENVDVLFGVNEVTVAISDDEDVPVINIVSSSTVRTVREATNNAFTVFVTTTEEMVPGLVEVSVEDGTALAGIDYEMPSPVVVTFNGTNGTASISVNILQRSGYQDNRYFDLVLGDTGRGNVLFEDQREFERVWILDNGGALFRLVIATLDKECPLWIKENRDEKLSTVIRTVGKVLPSLESLDNITGGILFCNDTIEDQYYVEFQAVVKTKQGEAASTISSLETWARSLPKLDEPYSHLEVRYSATCPLMLFAPSNPPCDIITPTNPGGLANNNGNSSRAVIGLSVVVALTVVIICVLVMLLIVTGLILWRNRKAVFTDKSEKGTKTPEYPEQPPENSLTRLSHSFGRTTSNNTSNNSNNDGTLTLETSLNTRKQGTDC